MTVLKGNLSYTYCVKDYCENLRKHIKRNYIPTSCQKEGTVEFQLVIDRGGDLCFIKEISSSGCSSLDQYAKVTIEKSFPFESFPDKTFQTFIDIIVPIVFKRRITL